jgi:hypothetical protein
VESGTANELDGRGIGVGDLNNDGALDMYQTNANQPALLFRGQPIHAGNWVELKLMGTTSNRDAIGARVTVWAGGDSFMREINGGNGYSGQSSTRVHVGIGRATRLDRVSIRWPNGQLEELPPSQVATLLNRFVYVREGKGVIEHEARMLDVGRHRVIDTDPAMGRRPR